MISPARRDMRAYRWQAFTHTVEFPLGIDLTGGTFAMHVRDYRDQAGSPRISLANAASPAEGISVAVVGVGVNAISTVTIRINETTLEGLVFPNPRGTDLDLKYDLHVTATGYPKARWIEGNFVVTAGSTQ